MKQFRDSSTAALALGCAFVTLLACAGHGRKDSLGAAPALAHPDARATAYELDVAGKRRAYRVYRPSEYLPGHAAVVVLHDGLQNMNSVLAEKTATRRWIELAERDGFLLIVPNAYARGREIQTEDGPLWNDLSSAGRRADVDDVAFILAAVEEAHGREAFDRRKLYVAGASNGGTMTMRLLIEAPTLFAAGATFAATLPDRQIPRPPSGTPLMMLNGTADPRVPWEGGAATRAVEESVRYFVRANRSDPAAFRASVLPDNQRDGCRVHSQAWTSPRGSAPAVLFFRVEGGGHSIPDPTPQGPLSSAGPQCRDVHGIDLAWHFLKRHRGRPPLSARAPER